MQKIISILFLFLLVSCYRATDKLDVNLANPPIAQRVSTSPFAPLSESEKAKDFGKEMKVAYSFALEQDYYRAIGSFKRALYLTEEQNKERRLEILYDIALCYYLGEKYSEAVDSVCQSELARVDEHFAAYHDLLVLLMDSFSHLGNEAQVAYLQSKIKTLWPEDSEKLSFFFELKKADLGALERRAENREYLQNILTSYECQKKSIHRAEMYNAILPGLGYLYVGQTQTAVTAFLINGLFIAASVVSFDHGNIPLGIILASFEGGWYFGGISGAGLAAKYHNDSLFNCFAERVAHREELYPSFRLHFTF